MKPKNKIYPLLRMLAVALTAALLGPGCQKDFKWNEPLAVTQNGLNLTSAAGSTRVTVYSTGRWKAEMAELQHSNPVSFPSVGLSVPGAFAPLFLSLLYAKGRTFASCILYKLTKVICIFSTISA